MQSRKVASGTVDENRTQSSHSEPNQQREAPQASMPSPSNPQASSSTEPKLACVRSDPTLPDIFSRIHPNGLPRSSVLHIVSCTTSSEVSSWNKECAGEGGCMRTWEDALSPIQLARPPILRAVRALDNLDPIPSLKVQIPVRLRGKVVQRHDVLHSRLGLGLEWWRRWGSLLGDRCCGRGHARAWRGR